MKHKIVIILTILVIVFSNITNIFARGVTNDELGKVTQEELTAINKLGTPSSLYYMVIRHIETGHIFVYTTDTMPVCSNSTGGKVIRINDGSYICLFKNEDGSYEQKMPVPLTFILVGTSYDILYSSHTLIYSYEVQGQIKTDVWLSSCPIGFVAPDNSEGSSWWDSILDGIFDFFTDPLGNILDAVLSIPSLIIDALFSLGDLIWSLFKGSIDLIVSTITGILDFLGALMDLLGNLLASLFVPKFEFMEFLNIKEKFPIIEQVVNLTFNMFDFITGSTPPNFAITWHGVTANIVDFSIFGVVRTTIQGIIIFISYFKFIKWVRDYVPTLLGGV